MKTKVSFWAQNNIEPAQKRHLGIFLQIRRKKEMSSKIIAANMKKLPTCDKSLSLCGLFFFTAYQIQTHFISFAGNPGRKLRLLNSLNGVNYPSVSHPFNLVLYDLCSFDSLKRTQLSLFLVANNSKMSKSKII